MSETKLYWVTCDITGKATCQVEASIAEEAMTKARDGIDLKADWDLDEWDLDFGFRFNSFSNFDAGEM